MKTTTMAKSAYVQAHGEPRFRNSSYETLQMWEKLQKVTVAEYLILEPDKGENIDKLRSSWATKLNNHAKKTNANFKIRFLINRDEKHIVVWKEPKIAAVAPGRTAAAGGAR